MTTLEFFLLIRRRLTFLLCSTIAGLVLSIYATSNTIPQFESVATIFVSTPPTLDGSAGLGSNQLGELAVGNSFTQERVKSYATIINSEATLLPVIKELGLSYNFEDLAEKISAVAPPETVLMYVKVIDPNPIVAADIANAVAKQFSETVLEIELNSTVDLTQIIKLSVVRSAVASNFPVSPNKKLNYLLGLIAGLSFAFAISLLLKLLDQGLKSENDLGETPLLGVVNFDVGAVAEPLVSKLNTYDPRIESFRLFRTNLLHALDKLELNCVAISSCFSGEGKTTSTINLGYVIAQAGFKVVIVEADMRRPTLAKYLSLEIGKPFTANYGLSDILETKTYSDLRKKTNSAITDLENPYLSLITCGKIPSNPAELLGSENFVDLLKILKEKFDYVLVDTPPILSVADASIISRACQSICLVVHAGKTTKRNFDAAREGLAAVGVKLNGVLLNKVPKHKPGDHYGYTYTDSKLNYYRYSYAYMPTQSVEYKKKRLNFFKKKEKKSDEPNLKKMIGSATSSENDSFNDFLKKYGIE